MSLDDQMRWDRQHAETHGMEQPSTFLRQILETDSWQFPSGRALDIAAGKGRNARYLAERGFEVVAEDSPTLRWMWRGFMLNTSISKSTFNNWIWSKALFRKENTT
jgi:hypothetical protein